MRGAQANAIVKSWEEKNEPIHGLDARFHLVDLVAKAIEAAYREGVETGTRAERARLRDVLGLSDATRPRKAHDLVRGEGTLGCSKCGLTIDMNTETARVFMTTACREE